jgi:phosphoribosylformylglycinamidine (FGAM) synthase-like enzyme
VAVALAEKTFAKGIGARVNLIGGGLPREFVLFGEDASRILLSCDAGTVPGIQEVAGKLGVVAEVIGETSSSGRVEILVDDRVCVSAAVAELRGDYEGALEAALRAEPETVAAGS